MLTPSQLQQRSALMQAVRNFFLAHEYIEVDTPIRLPVLIPEAEIEPLVSEDHFLQTSPELCMKRLLASGCSQLFQICHCFRKGERGRLHQEEFTLLEWYRTGWTYMELMQECEEMVRHVAQCCANPTGPDNAGEIQRHGKNISLAAPWQRITVDAAFRRYTGISAEQAVETNQFDEFLVEKVEPKLGWDTPVFLYDYPIALASLARAKQDNPNIGERFELYIGGIELANGFSELTDPAVQRRRFLQEIEKIASTRPAPLIPEKFLAALTHLPDCAGIALGLDRLFMLLLNQQHIDAVLPFTNTDL